MSGVLDPRGPKPVGIADRKKRSSETAVLVWDLIGVAGSRSCIRIGIAIVCTAFVGNQCNV